MSKRIIISVTPSQLESIKSAADNLSGMVGTGDEGDVEFKRIVKNIDKMLKNNDLPSRDYK